MDALSILEFDDVIVEAPPSVIVIDADFCCSAVAEEVTLAASACDGS